MFALDASRPTVARALWRITADVWRGGGFAPEVRWYPHTREGPLTSKPWCPRTEIGDVIIHHAAPKVWVAASVTQAGDLVGQQIGMPRMSRDSALVSARDLLQPGRQIYIYHRDDAEWEQVRIEAV
jgi:hypothetical protein